MSENTRQFKLIYGKLTFKQTESVIEYETRRFITAVMKEREVPTTMTNCRNYPRVTRDEK